MTREDFDKQYLARFHPQQLRAIHTVEGAALLLAVPGSGKTTVLIHRLGYMIQCCGIAPERILAMTYTRQATAEMRQRFTARFPGIGVPDCRTINSLCLHIIDYYRETCGRGPAFQVQANEGELARLVAELWQKIRGEYPTPANVKEIRTAITYAKNRMLSRAEILEMEKEIPQFSQFFDGYRVALLRLRQMDYDDQLCYALEALNRYPEVLHHFQQQYSYICVDEAQDTSKIQHEIIRRLAGQGNIFMVGDEDQSIYGFRAAWPEALMQFESVYPGAQVLMLEDNFRSTPEILRIADRFVRNNRDRRPKLLRATRPSGAAIHVVQTEQDEDQFAFLTAVAASNAGPTAVLYRNNDSALPLIDRLERLGLPYRCRAMDDTFFTHRVVADVTDIVHLAAEPANGEIFLRLYYKLCRGLTKVAAQEACAHSRRSGRPILQEVLACPEVPGYVKSNAAELREALERLPNDSATDGLRRIWDTMGYGAYLAAQQLDGGKFLTLRRLARKETDLAHLLQRLDFLRALVTGATERGRGDFLLSTVHASKGQEYETVYLLDVADGLLPSVLQKDDPMQYEEERRIFYVAMTRAKDHLYLFRCKDTTSSFTTEALRDQLVPVAPEEDVFAFLAEDLLGLRYFHRSLGAGTVAARCGDDCLVRFDSGEERKLSLAEMLTQRVVHLGARLAKTEEEKGLPRARARIFTAEEKRAWEAAAQPGRRIYHYTMGSGEVVRYKAPYVSIRFHGRTGEKMFDLLNSAQHGYLSYAPIAPEETGQKTSN